MARRKISIEEALQVLEEAGIPLQAKPLETVAPVIEQQQVSPAFVKKQSSPPNVVRIELRARHSVGSGGQLVEQADGEKQIEHAGVETYGPGVCFVTPALASYLLHADGVARQADDRMLDRTQRSFIVVQRQNSSGHLVNVPVEVDSEFYSNSPLEWGRNFEHIIR